MTVAGVTPSHRLASSTLALLAATAIGVVVGTAPEAALLPLLALLLAVPLVAIVTSRPWSLIYLIILSSALTGLVRGAWEGSGFSLSGIRWLAIAGLLGVLGLLRARDLRLWTPLWPWTLFSAWCAIWWAVNGAPRSGFKDVYLYAFPLLVGVIGAVVMAPDPEGSRERLARALLASLAVPYLIYAVTIPAGLVELTSNGPQGLLGPRPVATYALVILCVALPRWRYRLSSSTFGATTTLLAVGLVAFTFSRLALATVPLIMLIGFMRPKRLPGILSRVAVAASLAVVLLLSVPGVRDRMFRRPPETIAEVPETINLSGRDDLWRPTLTRWLERPWFGWGAGRLRQVVADSKDWPSKDVFPAEYPPHNEYFQVLHDEGVAGLAMLLLALGSPLLWHYRRWSASDGREAGLASAHLAAVLGITVVVANSVADNTLHYGTVTGPVFLLLASAYCLESQTGGPTSSPPDEDAARGARRHHG